MNFTARYVGAFMAVLFLFSTAQVAGSGAVASTASPQMSCALSEYRQFDFWVGDWDAFENNGATKVAHVRVDRILDGCVVREHYEDAGGLQGESFSIYDVGRRMWHQSWVTNRGQLLTIDGQRKDGEMILAGANADGLETSVRATWKLLESGDVRETAVRSSDAGRTWKPWFDLLFRRHQVLEGVGLDDAKAVSGLDEQFQAAVKANDDATIDKILSDESGADAGPLREQINLANLLQEIAVNGNFEARARSCSVFVGPVEACITTGVVDQVRRAIENVVQNVIRYTRANSQVEIRMCKRGLLPEATGLIQVRDYGPGVPQADLEKIFLPFYRVHSENDSDPGGSGLGLAITERIIRMHGGNVRATNAAEGGLLVELELPLIA